MDYLNREFYCRDPAIVAIDLLGKKLVKINETEHLSGIIVETEAYYGCKDPASRAYNGKKKYNKTMFETPGTLFIYMVHGWWLLNISAHKDGEVGAVLIRAIEPIDGIETMKKNRGLNSLIALTNGPGKLTKSLKITKYLNGYDIVGGKQVSIMVGWTHNFEIASSNRVGVTHDLLKPLRFYIRGNIFVSY